MVPKAATVVDTAAVSTTKAAAEGAIVLQSPDGSGEFVEGEG